MPLTLQDYDAMAAVALPAWLGQPLGWITGPQMAVYAGLAKLVPAKQMIVEVGTYQGKSALAFAWGSSQGNLVPVYTCDPHLTQEDARVSYGPHNMLALYKNLASAPNGLGQLVYCVNVPGVVAAVSWPTACVGLLYIDSLHTFDHVMVDTTMWLPALAPGAAIVFHDLNEGPVRWAVHKLIKNSSRLRMEMHDEPQSFAVVRWQG